MAFQNAWDEGYARVNEGFAEAVLEELELEPGASVFFHDYHLYLAPRLVRERAPDALMAHFIHIPWPQTDYWHVLPGRSARAIHDGLLANDVIGFHTRALAAELPSRRERRRRRRVRLRRRNRGLRRPPVARHACTRSRSTRPSSTSPQARDEVLAAERELEARRPEKLVLRVDRTDPSKNIVRGFRAFELYLDAHPEMHGRVGMLALLDPSRQDIPEYAEYLGAIQREARRVNDRFQQEGWTPIELVIEDNFAASVAAYKQFDVLFVNAIFDGMNLVAKEAPLVNERDGVLDPLRERRRPRGARRLGADGQPVRRRRPGRGDPPRADDAGGRAARAARGDPRARARARRRGLDRGAARRPRPLRGCGPAIRSAA